MFHFKTRLQKTLKLATLGWSDGGSIDFSWRFDSKFGSNSYFRFLLPNLEIASKFGSDPPLLLPNMGNSSLFASKFGSEKI